MKKNGINLEKVWNKLLDLMVPEKSNLAPHPEPLEEKDQSYTAHLEGWVSRDKNSRVLRLHCRPPFNFRMFKEYSKGVACLPKDHFPNLEYEDGAIKVSVIIRYDKIEENENERMDSKE